MLFPEQLTWPPPRKPRISLFYLFAHQLYKQIDIWRVNTLLLVVVSIIHYPSLWHGQSFLFSYFPFSWVLDFMSPLEKFWMKLGTIFEVATHYQRWSFHLAVTVGTVIIQNSSFQSVFKNFPFRSYRILDKHHPLNLFFPKYSFDSSFFCCFNKTSCFILQFCNKIIETYFEKCGKVSTLSSDYKMICIDEYCQSRDKTSTCDTYSELSRLCASDGPGTFESWRDDTDVVCGRF